MPPNDEARWQVRIRSLGAEMTTDDLGARTTEADFLEAVQHLLDSSGVLRIASSTPVPVEALTRLGHALGCSTEPQEPSAQAVPGSTFVRDLSAQAVLGAASPPAYIETLHYDSAGARPAPYSVAHTRSVPTPLAPQVWIDMGAVYADLPAELRTLVTGRRALHGGLPVPSAPLDTAPPFDLATASARPLVVQHWRTSEPVLYLPKHPDSTIEGLPEAKGRAALAALWARTAGSSARFQAVAQSNDVVIWDGLRTVHTNPPYPKDRDRTVWFFVVPGDQELTAVTATHRG